MDPTATLLALLANMAALREKENSHTRMHMLGQLADLKHWLDRNGTLPKVQFVEGAPYTTIEGTFKIGG